MEKEISQKEVDELKEKAKKYDEQQQQQQQQPKSEKLKLVDNPDKSKMEDETKKPDEKDEWVCEECNAVLGTAEKPPKFCSECGSELIEK